MSGSGPIYHTGDYIPTYPDWVDPDATLDFAFSWPSHFGDDARLAQIEWDVDGLTLGETSIRDEYVLDGRRYKNVAMAQITGFVEDAIHIIRCRATADNGQRDDRSAFIKVRHQ